MLDRIPTEEDWDNYEDVCLRNNQGKSLWDIDMQFAKKHFLGKSREQCFTLFEENFMACLDDYYAMPRICFRYYIFALAEYLSKIADLPKKSSIDMVIRSYSDAASCFLNFIKYRVEHDIESVRAILSDLWPYVLKVANNQDKYDAPIEIYGDFKLIAEEIKTLAQKSKIKI